MAPALAFELCRELNMIISCSHVKNFLLSLREMLSEFLIFFFILDKIVSVFIKILL